MGKIIANRLREPSTWAGLGVLAVLAGLPPGTWDIIVQVGTGVAGLAAVLLPEKQG